MTVGCARCGFARLQIRAFAFRELAEAGGDGISTCTHARRRAHDSRRCSTLGGVASVVRSKFSQIAVTATFAATTRTTARSTMLRACNRHGAHR